MAPSFPKYVVLKSRYNAEYLGYVKEEGEVQGFLRFGKAEFTIPLSKFEVESAKSDPKLVHLKSCYNNRYLAAQSQSSNWIVAEADKPEEDQSKWSCTLFQPVPYYDHGDDFRFKHVKTGNFAVLMRYAPENAFRHCLRAGWSSPNSDLCDVVTVIDWKSLLVLPRYVVLKSKFNGKYLEYVEQDENIQGYLRFSRVGYRSLLSKFRVEYARSDSQLVHLKSCYNNKYLTTKSETTHWIVPEADKPEEDQSKWTCTLFQPVPFSSDRHDFRFKHVKTGKYAVLARQSWAASNNCLYAGWPDPNSDLCDVVTVMDWTSLVVFPKYVVLKSKYNHKYLEYVKDEGKMKGYLRFAKDDFTSPLSKFEVELAESDSQLVHLKSCYTNKYSRAESQTSNWVVAEADKPEEDQSKWSCTLFEPVPFSDGEDDFRFKHVKTGNYAVLMRDGTDCLSARWQSPNLDLCDVVTIIDWTSLLVLPKYVAFEWSNGKYLSGRILDDGKHYMQFSSSDVGDKTVAHEVFRNPDGSIRLKSTHFDQFWRRDSSWVLADSDDTSTTNKNTIFWPVKVDRNIIALRSLGNGLFCKNLTLDAITNCLSATDSIISVSSQLQVIDLVRSREIYNIEFDLTRARKYNEQVGVMGTGEHSNTTTEAGSFDIKVKYGKPKSMSWKTHHSFNFKTKLVTKVPLIVDGKIELSPETTMSQEMGFVETSTDTFETVNNVVVPPMTKATVYAKGSTAMCEVPFSYNQADTYIDGMQHTHMLDDGTYTGMNCFNLFYEVKFENINLPELDAPSVQ